MTENTWSLNQKTTAFSTARCHCISLSVRLLRKTGRTNERLPPATPGIQGQRLENQLKQRNCLDLKGYLAFDVMKQKLYLHGISFQPYFSVVFVFLGGGGDWPYAQLPARRTKGCSLSGLYPLISVAWLNL